ncbi:MAG: hypothetical protein ACR2J0_06650 [Mycobacteriales bacterium]
MSSSSARPGSEPVQPLPILCVRRELYTRLHCPRRSDLPPLRMGPTRPRPYLGPHCRAIR